MKVTYLMPALCHGESLELFQLPDQELPLSPRKGLRLRGKPFIPNGPVEADVATWVEDVIYDVDQAAVLVIIHGPHRPADDAATLLDELRRHHGPWEYVPRDAHGAGRRQQRERGVGDELFG